MRTFLLAPLLILLSLPVQAADPADRVQVNPDSDPEAIELAQSVMEAMGGWDNWDATRYVSWSMFGGRRHWWDRQTGDIRIEMESALILMNVNTLEGRVWEEGEEIVHPDSLALRTEQGHRIWVNDSYWMFMPYKLLDPGVTLKSGGASSLEDGRAAKVLVLTFGDGTGYTPQNKYDVFVADDTGLVEQWAFYRNATDPEPGFTMPWADWAQFGSIMLSRSRGRDKDWNIAVHESLPASVFNSPEPVTP